jgi:hypothetical protein
MNKKSSKRKRSLGQQEKGTQSSTSETTIGLKNLPLIRSILKDLRFYKNVKDDLKWYHSTRDKQITLETTPPKTENIELHCAWVTEAFTPSKINRLVESLRKLGWYNSTDAISTGKDLIDWVTNRQNLGGGSAWINGGLITTNRNQGNFILGHYRYARLPKGVSFGRLSLHHVTSSLTLVTVQFVFNDEIGHSLNRPLNDKYETKVDYDRSGLKFKAALFNEVDRQKQQAVKEKIEAIHANLYSWFSVNLPGHFSSSKAKVLPTVDLITSKEYKQEIDSGSQIRNDYLSILLTQDADIWKYTKNDAIELRVNTRSNKATALLFGNLNDMRKYSNEYGCKIREALTASLWSLPQKLDSLKCHVSTC